MMSVSGSLPDDEHADIDVSTSVRMRSLRFEIVPPTRVWFEGFPGEVHSLRSERENLPDEVEPGVTYRDVTVRWQAAAWLGEPNWSEALDGRLRTRRLSRDAPRREL
jgi:hypothetical protein